MAAISEVHSSSPPPPVPLTVITRRPIRTITTTGHITTRDADYEEPPSPAPDQEPPEDIPEEVPEAREIQEAASEEVPSEFIKHEEGDLPNEEVAREETIEEQVERMENGDDKVQTETLNLSTETGEFVAAKNEEEDENYRPASVENREVESRRTPQSPVQYQENVVHVTYTPQELQPNIRQHVRYEELPKNYIPTTITENYNPTNESPPPLIPLNNIHHGSMNRYEQRPRAHHRYTPEERHYLERSVRYSTPPNGSHMIAEDIAVGYQHQMTPPPQLEHLPLAMRYENQVKYEEHLQKNEQPIQISITHQNSEIPNTTYTTLETVNNPQPAPGGYKQSHYVDSPAQYQNPSPGSGYVYSKGGQITNDVFLYTPNASGNKMIAESPMLCSKDPTLASATNPKMVYNPNYNIPYDQQGSPGQQVTLQYPGAGNSTYQHIYKVPESGNWSGNGSPIAVDYWSGASGYGGATIAINDGGGGGNVALSTNYSEYPAVNAGHGMGLDDQYDPSYGSVSPRTAWGKVITIIYALVGIPLMLIYLSTAGEVLARSFRRLYGRLFCASSAGDSTKITKNSSSKAKSGHSGVDAYLSAKLHNHIGHDAKMNHADDRSKIDHGSNVMILDCEGLGGVSGHSNIPIKHPHEETVRVPISLCLVIIVVYICGGAVLFNKLENWTFLEGSYFCFTSLGTIGFGDLVPGLYHSYQIQYQTGASTYTLEQLSIFVSSAYILIGMALIAMCFNLVQEEVIRLIRRFGKYFGVGHSHGGKGDDEDDVTGDEGDGMAMAVVSSGHAS